MPRRKPSRTLCSPTSRRSWGSMGERPAPTSLSRLRPWEQQRTGPPWATPCAAPASPPPITSAGGSSPRPWRPTPGRPSACWPTRSRPSLVLRLLLTPRRARSRSPGRRSSRGGALQGAGPTAAAAVGPGQPGFVEHTAQHWPDRGAAGVLVRAEADSAAARSAPCTLPTRWWTSPVTERPVYGRGRPSSHTPRPVHATRSRLKTTSSPQPSASLVGRQRRAASVLLTHGPTAGNLAHRARDILPVTKRHMGRSKTTVSPRQPEVEWLEASGFCRANSTMDHRLGALEKPVVLLRPMWRFVNGEDVPGTMGEVPRRGAMREQHEAARLCLPTSDALGLGAAGRLQPRARGVDRARRVGAGPAPAIHRPFRHGDVHHLVGSVHGAERRRCAVRLARHQDAGGAAVRPVLCRVLYEAWLSRAHRCCRRWSCALERTTTARSAVPESVTSPSEA